MENQYINDQLLKKISEEQNVKVSQINAVLKLIEEGATVPFIARYRKEATGGLDEEQIRAIYQEWDYGQKLAERKEQVMRLIEERKLTEELKKLLLPINYLKLKIFIGHIKKNVRQELLKRLKKAWSHLQIIY